MTSTLLKLVYFAYRCNLKSKVGKIKKSWQIWLYNSNFLLHSAVIVVIIRCHLSSHDVTVGLPVRAHCKR